MRDSTLYKRLRKLASSDDVVATSLLPLVHRTYDESIQVLKGVVRYMPQYTLHDQTHVDSVIEIMGRLIPTDTIKRLGPLEVSSLLLCAALHDVGMAISQTEIDDILGEESASEGRRLFLRFCEANEGASSRLAALTEDGRHREAEELRSFLLSKYIRQTHGDRVKRYIFNRSSDGFKYGDLDFTSQLAEVCFSHTASRDVVALLPCQGLVRSNGECVNWLFVAVVLRLADILDFDAGRTPMVLLNHLGVREPVSVMEWRKHIAVKALDIRAGRIAITARCPDPVIEDCVRKYVDQIDRELEDARLLFENMHDPATSNLQGKYRVDWPTRVDTRNVGPQEDIGGPLYEYRDLVFDLDKQSVMALVMGVSLYGDRKLFLRELLQNAVDACRHRQALHDARPQAQVYEPCINVRLCREGESTILEVEDNGMGMDEDIVRDYFAKVGKSYYTSHRFHREAAENGFQFKPVSIFGIGVLSAFMVSDKLRVRTCRAITPSSSDRALDIEIDGPDTLFWFRRGNRDQPGTSITLDLKHNPFLRTEDAQQVAASAEQKPTSSTNSALLDAVFELAPHVEFPILVRDHTGYFSFTGAWSAPTLPSDLSNYVRVVRVDFTNDGPEGLDGIADVLVLQTEDNMLVDSLDIEDQSFYCYEVERVLCDRLAHEHGYVKHVYVDYSVRDSKVAEHFNVEVTSEGRWSQRGFRIPFPLFAPHSFWRQPSPSGLIDFPFPVLYDIDLSGDYAVALTADRLRPTLDLHSRAIANKICEALASLLMRQLGPELTPLLAQIHTEITKTKSTPADDILRRLFSGCSDFTS